LIVKKYIFQSDIMININMEESTIFDD